MFSHEGLDREGKGGGVEQDLTAAIDRIKFSEKLPQFSAHLGGKWEMTLSNIPLKSCKRQVDSMENPACINCRLFLTNSSRFVHPQ